MQNLTKGPQDTLILSRGKIFQAQLKQRTPFPEGAEGIIEVFDLAGGLIATFYGTAVDRTLTFAEPASVHDEIPAGSVFEFSLTDPLVDDPIPISHGEVVREQAYFPFAAPTVIEDPARQFSDNFSSIVSRRWIRMAGNSSLVIHDNGSDPNSMGPNYGWTSNAACLWYAPMSMDSVTITVKMLKLHSWLGIGDGAMHVILCSNSSMTSYLGIQFKDSFDAGQKRVNIFTGTTPFTGDIQESVSHVITSGDVYTVKYNHLMNTVSVYLGEDLTPLASWEDTGNLIAHGSAAFRYTGMAFYSSALSPTVEVTDWEAHDGV